MKRTKFIFITLIMISFIFFSCSKDSTGPDNQEVIVPETTEIIGTETANMQIEEVDENGTIIVDENSTLADLEVGEILIVDVCDAAPDGLLRKIINRIEENGSVLFETEQASLAEAVQQLTLSKSYQLTPEDVRQVNLYNGSSYIPERDGFEFPIDIDCVLYDQDGNYFTTNDQIKLYGDLTFTAELFTEIEISWFALNKFEIGIESQRDANLNLNASLFWEFNEELTFGIAEFNFTPITFMAGPVPVLITPVLNVEAHIHGDLTVTFTTGITYNESVRYGIGYENDEWYQIKESDKTFNYDPPQFTTEFNFETGASLRLSTLIYGVIGPYVRAKAGLHFQAILEVNPTEMHLNYDLEAILYAICGIYFEVLDYTLLDEFIEFNIYTHPIGEWTIPLGENLPPNQPCNPNPGNGATDISTDTNLSWSCTDPDGDPLTYDVSFGTSPNPPLENSGQTGNIFDLNNLSYDIENETTYYWKIKAHDDHNNETESEVWAFTTTDNEIPEGMVLVESGTFLMGDHFNEGDSDELPTHEVEISSFFIGETEVTQAEYEEVIGSNPSNGYGVGDNYPVYNVSWFDVVTYCNARSEQENLTPCYDLSDWSCDFNANGYRLPTEAEWEFAARGGVNWTDDFRYSGCNETTDLQNYAWYDYISNSQTHPVGTKLPNQTTIYDMSGNVEEWCYDWYENNYYSNSPVNNPTGPESGSYRVIRGGSWFNGFSFCRVAQRIYSDPPYGYSTVGFRICRKQ